MRKTLVATQLKGSLRHPVTVLERNIPYRNSKQIDAFIHWFGDMNLGSECLEYGPCIFKDVNVEWCNLALMEVKHYFALCSCNCGNFTNSLQAAFSYERV